jgi:hypothetical protein
VGLPILVRKTVNEGANALAAGGGVVPMQRVALCRDLSVTGLYFLSAGRFALRDVLEIQLTLGSRPYKINAIVVRTIIQKNTGRESYGCGVHFVKNSSILASLPAIAAYLRKRFKSIGMPQPAVRASVD